MENSITLTLNIDDEKAIRKMIGVLNGLVAASDFVAASEIKKNLEGKPIAPAVKKPVDIPKVEAEAPSPTPPPSVLPDFELDSRGMPWDERIHSRTRSKLANGTWKYKRGITPAEKTAVEAEIATNTESPVPASRPEQETAVQLDTETAAPAPKPPEAPRAPAASTAPKAPPPAAAPVAPENITYEHIQAKVTAGIQASKINADVLMPLLNRHGLNTMRDLMKFPEFLPAVSADLDAIIGTVH